MKTLRARLRKNRVPAGETAGRRAKLEKAVKSLQFCLCYLKAVPGWIL